MQKGAIDIVAITVPFVQSCDGEVVWCSQAIERKQVSHFEMQFRVGKLIQQSMLHLLRSVIKLGKAWLFRVAVVSPFYGQMN